MRLVDSHCHLDVSDFETDLAETLDRARNAGVNAFIVPAIAAGRWPHLAELATRHADLHPAYGLHPMFLAEHTDSHLAALPDWLARAECVAVGECGLDYFVPGLDPDRQETVFIEHIRLAAALGKPLIIHARKATERVIQLLKRHGPATGVVHSYSGSLQQAWQLTEMGFLLGIGGPLTYPRSSRLRGIVTDIPLEHLLLETDAPDQPMHGEQGRRNEPAKLARVAQAMADARGIAPQAVAERTSDNAARLFGLAR